MENAAIGAADAIERLPSPAGEAPVLIIAGPGNNGGDGLALARHLHIRGRRSTVLLAGDPERLSPDAGSNLRVLRTTGVPIRIATTDAAEATRDALESGGPAVVVDALFGTGLTRPLEGQPGGVVTAINSARRAGCIARVVALDVPSGLDADSGAPIGHPEHPTVRADLTVTFAALKRGFFAIEAQEYLGGLVLVPIGVPPEFVARFGEPLRDARRSHARDDAGECGGREGPAATPGREPPGSDQPNR
jgi:hydroxyethylthiazole kinase-like uncharacterized protein yjeF